MKSSPENRMKSMRPATSRQRPPAYAMPTTSQSAMGRCSAVSVSVLPGSCVLEPGTWAANG